MGITASLYIKRRRSILSWSFIAGDEVVLEEFGWTAKAKEMRAEIEEGRRLAMEKKIQEMAERNAAREKAIREKPPGFAGLAPLSQEQIMKARQEWGISS